MYPVVVSASFILFKFVPVVLLRISVSLELLQVLIYPQPIAHGRFSALCEHIACLHFGNLVPFENPDLHIALHQQLAFFERKADLLFRLHLHAELRAPHNCKKAFVVDVEEIERMFHAEKRLAEKHGVGFAPPAHQAGFESASRLQPDLIAVCSFKHKYRARRHNDLGTRHDSVTAVQR